MCIVLHGLVFVLICLDLPTRSSFYDILLFYDAYISVFLAPISAMALSFIARRLRSTLA